MERQNKITSTEKSSGIEDEPRRSIVADSSFDSLGLTAPSARSILKKRRFCDCEWQIERKSERHAKFDEENINATYRKNICKRKIDEPKTPYISVVLSSEDISKQDLETPWPEVLTEEALIQRLTRAGLVEEKASVETAALLSNGSTKETVCNEVCETEDERKEKERRESFHLRRKLHYDEYHTIQLFRALNGLKADDDFSQRPEQSKNDDD